MGNYINKKFIIAISFATIMVMVGFTGLMYYNNENNNKTNTNICAIVNNIAEKYKVKNINEMNQNNINKDIRMVETFYKGNSYKGYVLSEYINNTLKSSVFVIMNNNETNFIITPVKSDILNKPIIINANTTDNKTKNNITPDTAALICYDTYLKISGGKGVIISLNQENTERLIVYLTTGGSFATASRIMVGKLAGSIASSLLSALIDALDILIVVDLVGAGVIAATDAYGGLVGVYFGMQEGWFNIPYPIYSYNPVPSDYAYVLCTEVNL